MAITTMGEASPAPSPVHSAPGTITCSVVPGDERLKFLPRVFGRRYIQGETAVFTWMRRLCRNYNGGFWDFVDLSNGGFYLRLVRDEPLAISVSTNDYAGAMSADAASIVVSLFAINELLFDGAHELDDAYYALRDYALQHAECREILKAID
jgi:hypothetical protein